MKLGCCKSRLRKKKNTQQVTAVKIFNAYLSLYGGSGDAEAVTMTYHWLQGSRCEILLGTIVKGRLNTMLNS